MKVRGERECQDCEARWSYYQTGSVACPECGSLHSVGIDARTAHTDAPATLDLTDHRARFGDARGVLPEESVDDLKRDLRAYVRKRGFIRGGELRPLDAEYLAARELLEAVDAYDRLVDPTDGDRAYLLELLSGADDGERPGTTEVPDTLREARGMAAVRAVEAYRDDLAAFLDELSAGGERAGSDGGERAGSDGGERAGDGRQDPDGPTVTVEGDDPTSRVRPARERIERLRDRANRIDALGGDVDPAVADALVDAADVLGAFVRTGDRTVLTQVDDRVESATTVEE